MIHLAKRHFVGPDRTRLFRETSSQSLEPSVVVIPDIAERFRSFLGDISERESFEEHHLNGSFLGLVQSAERFFDHSCNFLAEQLWRPGGAFFPVQHFIKFGPVVKLSQHKVVPPVHAPMVGILQKPHFKTAFGGIEFLGNPINFKKYILSYFFGLRHVPYDLQGSNQNEPMKAVEQYSERVPITLLDGVHDFFVAELLKLWICALRATPR
jgi:hypothetical protein